MVTYSHAWRAPNPPASVSSTTNAAISTPTTATTYAISSVVLNAALVSVLRRTARWLVSVRARAGDDVAIDKAPVADLGRNPIRSGCRIDGAYTPARAVTCTGRAQPNGGAGRARNGACITVASRVQVPQLDW